MSELITSAEQIPDAPFYVLMRDTFLSDWGQADRRDAFYIAVCRSRSEAELVAANARARGDQDEIDVLQAKPLIHREARFGLMTRESSERWYRQGAFAEEQA